MGKVGLTYIGFSEDVLNCLIENHQFDLVSVITEEGRLSDHVYKRLIEHSINFHIIKGKDDLKKLSTWIQTDHVVMYKFGYIIPPEIVEQFNIFNIHPGDLKKNRGPHPLNWSIILGDMETCLSLYKIDKRIDLGLLIETYKVPILEEDDTQKLEKRLNVGLEYILEGLYKYISGLKEGILINDGKYNPKVHEKDYTINLESDSFEQMCRKIRSQKAYKGAILELKGYRFYVSSIEKYEE